MDVLPESLEHLKCTLCSNYLSYFPIQMDVELGAVCGRCTLPDNSETAIRNVTYEVIARIMQFPCRFRDQGCVEYMRPDDIPNHERSCAYLTADCPAKTALECAWHGPYAALLHHYETKHPVLVLAEPRFEIDLCTSTYTKRFLLPHGEELFMLENMFDSHTNIITCSVYYIGIASNAGNFNYQLILENGSKTHSINFPSNPVVPMNMNNVTEIAVDNVRERLHDPTTIVGVVQIIENEIVIERCQNNPNVNYELLSVLECPFCFHYMVPPIYLCVLGHSMCNECSPKYPQCPTCEKANQGTRNFDLEKIAGILVYPCKNHDFGCNFTGRCRKIKEHEKFCSYSEQDCPVKDYVVCDSKMTTKQMYSHIQTYHHDNLLEIDKISVFIGSDYYRNVDEFCCVLKFSLHIFRLNYLYEGEKFSWCMQLIGMPEECANYNFEIDIVDNSNQNLRLYVRAAVVPFCPKIDCFKDGGSFIMLHLDQLRDLISEDLTYKVRILKVTK